MQKAVKFNVDFYSFQLPFFKFQHHNSLRGSLQILFLTTSIFAVQTVDKEQIFLVENLLLIYSLSAGCIFASGAESIFLFCCKL